MGLYKNENGILSPIAGRGNIDGVYKAQGILGAKNLVPYPYYRGSSFTTNGITFVANADGSVTANGTATADASYSCVNRLTGDPTMDIKVGEKYILSGAPDGSSYSTYYLMIIRTNNESVEVIAIDYGDSVSFTLPTSEEYYGITITIKAGQTVNNLTFYPMLRLASDTDNTYQPYAMTNKELTDKADYKEIARSVKDGTKTYGQQLMELKPYFDALSFSDKIKAVIYVDNGDIYRSIRPLTYEFSRTRVDGSGNISIASCIYANSAIKMVQAYIKSNTTVTYTDITDTVSTADFILMA